MAEQKDIAASPAPPRQEVVVLMIPPHQPAPSQHLELQMQRLHSVNSHLLPPLYHQQYWTQHISQLPPQAGNVTFHAGRTPVPPSLLLPGAPFAPQRYETTVPHDTSNSLPLIVPHENDVLMGRGAKNNSHSGNEKLRQAARKLKYEYLRATIKEKRAIARQLVKYIQNLDPPGRFLSRSSVSFTWVLRDDEYAYEKVRQCFRDAINEDPVCCRNAVKENLMPTETGGANQDHDNNVNAVSQVWIRTTPHKLDVKGSHDIETGTTTTTNNGVDLCDIKDDCCRVPRGTGTDEVCAPEKEPSVHKATTITKEHTKVSKIFLVAISLVLATIAVVLMNNNNVAHVSSLMLATNARIGWVFVVLLIFLLGVLVQLAATVFRVNKRSGEQKKVAHLKK